MATARSMAEVEGGDETMSETAVAQWSSLAQGMTPVDLGGSKLLLVRDGDAVRAFEGLCPHAKAPLHEGALCGGRIICPWHMGAFDASTGVLLEPVAMRGLATHPVRVLGDDVMVDPVPWSAPARPGKGEEQVFVLAGAGAAAAMAAVTLRHHGFTGRLLLVSPEVDEPLDRTQFSKMALSSAEFDRGTLPLFDEATWRGLAVERSVARVTAIDPAAKQLSLSTGRTVNYDAVLLATGSAPIPLDVPGADGATVCLLRTLSDVDAILARVRAAGRAVIVGTSFIGMEVASALAERKMAVTVVGREAAPFAKLFGDRVAGAVRSLHESKGVMFRIGAKVRAIGPDAVTLETGEVLPAELVVVGAGVGPVVDFAGDLPHAQDGGLAVDRSMQVADGIWAAGDMASPAGWPRIEHWRVAQQHGRIAALAMLGQAAVYEGVPFFWSAQHGKRLHYLGHASDWDEIAYDGDVEGFDFIAWYIKDDAVAAALICGRDAVAARLSDILRSRRSLLQARQLAAV